MRPTVLVVMLPECRGQLQKHFKRCGVEVITAACCTEARDFLDRDVPILAIFSSLRLPDGGYGHLLQWARQRGRYIPIIVCLDQADGGWVDLLEAGAFRVLAKPYEQEQIRTVINTVLPAGRRAFASGK